MNINSGNDQAFLKRLVAIIESNLSNENFGVKELAEEMRMNRSSIHRRLKLITKKSVSEFIREIKLQKAKELLEVGSDNVSEVAYNVGFSSPSYFSKCFHDYYGYSPGEVKRNLILDETSTEPEKVKYQNKFKKQSKIIIFTATFIILIISGLLIYQRTNVGVGKELSIVVLPFKNLSDDISNQYFADGIREDILNNLYWITSLRVISNTTAESFGENLMSAHEIAHQVNAKYILEGSVRYYDNKIRISAQLIDAEKDDHIWSDYYDRELNNIIGVQNEIAIQVANKLKTILSEKEIRQIEKISTQNWKAYDYYLQARFLLHRANSLQRSGFNAAGVINSVQYYNKAIEEDAGFPEAYAGLANATTQLTAWGIARDTGMVSKTYQLCQKALELDPECAEAHAVLGLNYWFRHNFEKSGEEYKRSIDLNPNFASARQWYAQHLMITGPISEARKQVDKALELEPYFWVVKSLDSWIAYFEKDYQKSLEICEVARDLNPSFPMNAWLYFLNYVKLNEAEKAHQQIKEIARIYSNSTNYSEEIDQAFTDNGIDGLFMTMIDINNNHPISVEGLNGSPFYTAWWYAVLGNKEESLNWLEKTIANKIAPYHYLNLILNHPDFEFLRDEPRFRAVADSLGLSPYWVNVKF